MVGSSKRHACNRNPAAVAREQFLTALSTIVSSQGSWMTKSWASTTVLAAITSDGAAEKTPANNILRHSAEIKSPPD